MPNNKVEEKCCMNCIYRTGWRCNKNPKMSVSACVKCFYYKEQR